VTLLGDAPAGVVSALSRTERYALSKPGVALQVTGVEISPSVSEAEICKKYLAEGTAGRQAVVDFASPCAFKSAGEYVFMPTKELIVQSCVNRWNMVANSSRVDDPDAIADLTARCRITRYRLQSASYDVKRVKIPGFVGSATISVRGPEPLVRLFRLLIAFGGAAGVGIKTALGMGGCKVTLDGEDVPT
jgi:CRISPR-associated endoribonuclease Cas6